MSLHYEQHAEYQQEADRYHQDTNDVAKFEQIVPWGHYEDLGMIGEKRRRRKEKKGGKKKIKKSELLESENGKGKKKIIIISVPGVPRFKLASSFHVSPIK